MNNEWCKFCKAWLPNNHNNHILYYMGTDIRYHIHSPRCGDVWELLNGIYAVVDYVDSFSTGVTFCDIEQVIDRKGYYYTLEFGNMLKKEKAKLISAYEDFPYPTGLCSYGWSSSEYKPDKHDFDGTRSLNFLKYILQRKK